MKKGSCHYYTKLYKISVFIVEDSYNVEKLLTACKTVTLQFGHSLGYMVLQFYFRKYNVWVIEADPGAIAPSEEITQ